MTRIPSTVAVASLDTHRLIIAVPNKGAAEMVSNLPRPVAASVLRQLADQLDGIASPSEALLAASAGAPEAFTRAIRKAQRPAGLDPLLGYVAASMADEEHQAAEEPAPLTPGDVRDALAFNAGERDQVLATLRDVLLDTTTARTPDQALATARILLDAHARQIAALVEAHRANIKGRWGLSRSTRSLLTGYEGARKIVTAYAAGLADEQALAEDAATEPADR
ncbi:hypothetical protein ACIQWZ_12425 [Streptomyces sp. NPDC098077]|uniref:hypothetical protein n=1 Tax=Streptomyces sp. NPDC098077 TaxID=3366093 RepID=UPI00381E25A8